MGQPERPVELDETLLDEGRQRWFAPRDRAGLVTTLVDPGRHRPAAAERPEEWPEGALPDLLAARYELVRRLDVPASQADLYLVRAREDGTDAVLKRRHTARPLDPGLVAYLGAPDDHLVRHLEAGAGYEVMDYLPGGSLRAELETGLRRFGFADLWALVQQLSAGLANLHRAGYVHRDVKPANIMLRPTGPLDLTLVDFGIAGPVDGTEWPDDPNLAYQPPEWSNLRQVSKATDWWGLGMTVAELAAGEHPFAGLGNEDIRDHFGRYGAIDVSGVPSDPPADGTVSQNRLRNLCQGLLAPDPALRWGQKEVGSWLVGGDPELPPTVVLQSAPIGSTDIAAAQPFSFAGRDYFLRSDLATELATDWNYAVQALFERDGIGDLRKWLDQFPDGDGAEARGVADAVTADTRQPGNVRLLRVLQALHPTRLPVYRNHVISRRTLLALATDAQVSDGDHASVLTDLWNYRLLPGFDSASPADPTAGSEDLTDVDQRWMNAYSAWPALVEQVTESAARDDLRRTVDERHVLAVCLRMALDRPDDLHQVQQQLRRFAAALPERIPWYDRLVGDSSLVWVALLLSGYAAMCAGSAAEERADEEREQERLHAEAAFREWSRRQNRPVALGWAVAGVCLIAALWLLLITAGDLAPQASDSVIEQAWAGAAVCLVVSLIAECLLAVEIGGRFHRRYSIPGAGSMALRSVGRWMWRFRLPAATAILAAAAATGWLAIHSPLLVGIPVTLAHLVWVAHRWGAWPAQQIAEDAQITAAQLRRPSDTDTA